MTICDNIKKRYIRLSKGQRKVAQFIVDNPNIIASHIASEVGRLAGVSESTVIRFCYAMDLSGFSELQEEMKAYVLETGGIPLAKQSVSVNKDISEKQEVHSEILARNIVGITKMFESIDASTFECVVKFIHHSKRIHILGFKQDTPAASFLYNNLSTLRSKVHFINDNAESIAQQLSVMDEGSVLCAIVLDGQDEDVITTMNIAKCKNAKILTIHDQPLDKKMPVMDASIELAYNEHGRAVSAVEIFSVLHAIIECVVKQDEEAYTEYRENYQQKSSRAKLVAIG